MRAARICGTLRGMIGRLESTPMPPNRDVNFPVAIIATVALCPAPRFRQPRPRSAILTLEPSSKRMVPMPSGRGILAIKAPKPAAMAQPIRRGC